jgi:hypothetical protein
MATYREISDYVALHFGFTPRPCWIAHVKADNGLTIRIAHNRANAAIRVKPCPESKWPAIKAALQHFGMIGN